VQRGAAPVPERTNGIEITISGLVAVLSPRKRRGGALNSLFGFQVSLFNENRSLLPSEKFPVPLSREFHRKLLKFYTAYAR
jgi:hypothetical protein